MIPSTYRDLVELLSQRTVDGAVVWRGTTTIGRYAVAVGEVTYEIEDGLDENEGTLRWFRVRGDKGRTIDSFKVGEMDGEDWDHMDALYGAARRAVARVDESIQLLKRASADSPVGGGTPAPLDEGTEIPF